VVREKRLEKEESNLARTLDAVNAKAVESGHIQ